jgi:hypothetical protein
MLALMLANHDPESLANVSNVCRFCGRVRKWPHWGQDGGYRSFGAPSEGRGSAARCGITACLKSAAQRYPSCKSVANTTIGSIVCDNAAPCALEITTRQTDPRIMMGGRMTNLNRIPRTDPINMLQMASAITNHTP